MSAVRSLVLRFYLYRALVAEGFVYPVITIYAFERGLTLAAIGLATGAFFLGTLVGEVPTGYIGDRVGRRNSLVLGAITISLTHIGFAVAESVSMFVLTYAFWGVAVTFRSGSADAWLYDSLVDHDATNAYTRIRGRATSTFYASAASTALLGGLLYELRPQFPFVAAAGVTALAAFVVATLPEPDASRPGDGFSAAEARTALLTVVRDRQLGAFVVLSGVVLAVPETIEVFVQPVARSVGFRPATLGPLYAGLMLTASTGSALAPYLERRLGPGRWFTLGPVLLVGGFLLAIPRPTVAIPGFFLARSVNTASTTLGSTYLNERLASRGRATALSGVSMVYALLFFCSRAFGGAIAANTSPLVAIAALGCLAVVVVIAIRLVADPFASSGRPDADTPTVTHSPD